MNNRRYSAIALVAALTVAGCGGGAASPAPTTSPTAATAAESTPAATTAPATAEPTPSLAGVELTLWAAAASAKEADPVIADFEAATGAKVNTVVIPDPYETSVSTKLATGAKPDLMFWQPTTSALSSIKAASVLQPLTGETWEASLAPSVSSLGVIDGVRYAAPVTIPSAIGVYYNKDVFTKAGISAVPQNWTELLAAADKVKAAGVSPFYEVGKDMWPLQWAVQVQLPPLSTTDFWPKLNKNEASWTDPEIVKAITNYKTQIIDAGLTNPDYKTGTFVEQGNELLSGKSGMAFQLGALLSEMQAVSTTEELNQKIGFFPISPDGTIATGVPDQTNAVVAPKTGDSAKEAAARDFLAFWLGPDYANFIKASNAVSIQPSVPSPSTVPEAAVSAAKALDTSVGAFQVQAIVSPDMHLYLADMLYGKKTPEQVAKACEDQFKAQAAAMGAPGF